MTSILAGGFQNCTSLTEITLPESVIQLYVLAFSGCANLKTINLDHITQYDRLVFSGCTNLELDVTFPADMTVIPSSLFAGCAKIRSVTFPENLTEIGYSAFQGCSSLTEINIPETVTAIGNGAFSDCSGITEITIPQGCTSIGGQTFRNCSMLTHVNIHNNITSIGSEAFRRTNLETLTIPSSVSTLTQVAFADMPNLKTAIIEEGEAPLTFGLGFFYKDAALTSVTFPSNTAAFDNRVLLGCSNLETITCKAIKAPTVKFEDFGMIASDGRNFLAGLNVPDGQKKLIVPTGATGYEDDLQADGTENYWKTVLLNPDKCGYTIEYRDNL